MHTWLYYCIKSLKLPKFLSDLDFLSRLGFRDLICVLLDAPADREETPFTFIDQEWTDCGRHLTYLDPQVVRAHDDRYYTDGGCYFDGFCNRNCVN